MSSFNVYLRTSIYLVLDHSLRWSTPSVIFYSFLPRSCYDTLVGHQSTVWAISFDKSGENLGRHIILSLFRILFLFVSF